MHGINAWSPLGPPPHPTLGVLPVKGCWLTSRRRARCRRRAQVQPHLEDRHTIVSIAAGITLQSLKARCKRARGCSGLLNGAAVACSAGNASR